MREYNLNEKILPLKAILLDVDGVMTPGGIWYSDSGDQFKRFDVQDGLGLVSLRELGMKIGIVTGKKSELLKKRAGELRVDDLYQESPLKMPAFEDFAAKHGLKSPEIAFIGDEVIDIPVMRVSGFSACPSDAVFVVRRAVDWVARSPGGNGCLREISEIIIAAKTGNYPPDSYFMDLALSIPPKKA